MSSIVISHPTKIINTHIELPHSKSISNRLLVMNALSKHPVEMLHLSDADDTKLMQEALNIRNGMVNVGNAGTCMRFLTAYYALMAEDVVLHGTERMHQRPIGDLVDVLVKLGADIDYVDQIGFPPLRIKGKKLKGETVSISTNISSQFISALMMIAPMFEKGLTIQMIGPKISASYLDLTAKWMRKNGIVVDLTDNTIKVSNGDYIMNATIPEPDWSAASYWYVVAAFAKKAEIQIANLTKQDTQPDAIIANYMLNYGINTTFHRNHITLSKINCLLQNSYYSLKQNPDIVPSLAVLFAGKNLEAELTDIAHLRYKETDRMNAIVNELNKLGFDTSHTSDAIQIMPSNIYFNPNVKIETYGDHRMAMAFAPLALLFDHLTIMNPEVVNKSYPHFWQDLKKAGFKITST
jgi:3-phosphoshikimate 1-carboxyvinyltransferase